MTVEKWLCTTCYRVFDGRLTAVEHTKRHRRKRTLSENTTPDDFIRPIEVDPDETEEGDIFRNARNEPDDHDPQVTVDGESIETEKTRLSEYE